MLRYRETIDAPVTAEAAFDYVARLENLTDWDPGTKRSVQAVGEGPGAGSEYDVVVGGPAGDIALRYRVTSSSRPSHVAFEAESKSFRSADSIDIEAAGDGSRVTYDARLQLKGLIVLATPIMWFIFRRTGQRGGDGLRRALQRLAST